ncbi:MULTISPECIES: PEP-CTERM sorting domain-containing protein [unclassified Lentimonas]|uniref:PEP-CTERM sorting domain-containing protein n=1 Tax=unclassified Lentimonas TaxID=2630993 RepID=UPI00132892CE|nr:MULTISPECIES: PEP-CTERM sorting domain-containing protein [unclassified Lentimonas]CAA6692394.1 Unannotated [Lentimonas sp. CC19]CAA6693965.1 Unannotated [Lentimonas sp. CC10]CAA7072212.1 Unannotated [Lentimonas sp. CC11]
MNKTTLVLATTLAVAYSAQAALITNGDFSDTTNSNSDADTNNLSVEEANNGWGWKAGWSLTSTTGVAEMSTAFNNNYSIAQINSVTSETGSSLTLGLDWTPDTGSTFTSLSYHLVGWIGTPTAGTDMFRFINGDSDGIQGGGATMIDLLDGTSKGTGNSTASSGTVAGTAGSTTNFSTTIDLSGYASGSSVSDYDYIGIRFSIMGADDTAQGSLIDNVSLVAVPEPGTYALIGGLFALGFVMVRRRK